MHPIEILPSLLPLLFLLFLLFVLLQFSRLFLGGSFSRGRARRYPYQQRDKLFTPAEWRFYQALQEAIPEGMTIFGKVRVADVLKPEKGLDRSTWQTSFNKIAGKHFDFVLVESDSGRMVCAIELNDRSHLRSDRQKRDSFLVSACKNAQFPLLMSPAARHYDPMALRAEVQAAIAGEAPPAPKVTPIPPLPVFGLSCPRCGSPLLEKTARRGKNAGRSFLSCADFPRCRYAQPR